jgi:rRNA maturation RNase YbeY
MPAKSHSRDEKPATVSLRISIRAQRGAEHARFLRHQLQSAHGLLRSPLAELSIALVGDRRMSDLHSRFMSIAGPTDVLTFPLEIDEGGHATSGEVVICVPEAERRVDETGVPLAHELLLYAIHGMLHLSGYDDGTAREYKIMHRKEDDLLSLLGIGPVFQPPGFRVSNPRQPSGRRASGRGGSGKAKRP